MKTKNKPSRKSTELAKTVNWDEAVPFHTLRNGKYHAPNVMAVTKGVKRFPADELFEAIIADLRRGYECRLTNADEDAIRLYPMTFSDSGKVAVVGATMKGGLRSCLESRRTVMYRRGHEMSRRSYQREISKIRQNRRELVGVTPDTTVNCPKCGFRFRVHKQLH